MDPGRRLGPSRGNDTHLLDAHASMRLDIRRRFAVTTEDHAYALNDSNPRQVQRVSQKQRLRNEIMTSIPARKFRRRL